MSGTSMDGVDLALIKSDGKNLIERKKFAYFAYDKKIRTELQSLIYGTPSLLEIKKTENNFSDLNVQIVNKFLQESKIDKREIDLIAFHGHTILHAPQHHITWQIGNPHLLAVKTGIDVIADFRSRDIALGGQGAPLVPIYHYHLLQQSQKLPLIVLNIGGISNITYFSSCDETSIAAFDICFGNAPFDDLLRKKMQLDYDKNGELSKKGTVDFILADRILQNDIFYKNPPKSFDRDDFAEILAPINNLKIEDALATFAYMHAKVIQINCDMLEKTSHKPKMILVCGGGRKNIAIMDEMKKWLSGIEIKSIDELGFDGDAVEAEAFAFLAIRRMLNLPISFQKTTGVSQVDNCAQALSQQCFSSCGGVFYHA